MTSLLLGAALLGNLGISVAQDEITILCVYVFSLSYGEPEWIDVPGCQKIRKHHCDLSDMTSEPREWYYARKCVSHAAKISPPVLRLNVTEQPAIVVRVKPPRDLVRKLHSNLYYKIYLTHPSGEEEVFDMKCCSHKLTLKDLNHREEYCLQAQIVLPLQGKHSARSSLKCVTTL
uniref:Interleukin-22 receptor subunit alpha-2-like n=1 Tax=Pundamilia nyererei TaxID=303518 RepID=A0A3B4EVR6_9CICH